MTRYTKRPISIRPDVDQKIKMRMPGSSYSGIISEHLSRYFELLRRERAVLRPMFSEAECGLLLDIGNGTIYSAFSVSLLWAEVEDSAPDGTAQKWGVDLGTLAAKLRKLTYGQSCALVDAIERWWESGGTDYATLLDEPAEPAEQPAEQPHQK